MIPAATASPWKLGGLSLRELARRVWREIGEDDVSERAAALSYYFLFALFPALLFLTALLGFLPLEGLQERLLAYARGVLPPDAASTVERTLGEVLSVRRTGLVSLGALITLWASSNGMVSVMNTMNRVWDVDEDRPWWKRRAMAVGLTLVFAVFIVAALIVLVFGGRIGHVVAETLGLGALFSTLWRFMSMPMVVACVLIGIEVVYYVAPAGPRRWRWITPGAMLALGLWLGMSLVLRTWIANFGNYSATYGSIGGVIILMFWLYLTSFVLLVGAEVDAEIEKASRRETPRRATRAA